MHVCMLCMYAGPERGEMEPGPVTNVDPHTTPKAI
jgi:hypothetical protein